MNPIELHFDILNLLAQQYPSLALSEVNLTMHGIVNQIYVDAIQFIIKEFPSLNHPIQSTNKIKYFVELVDELRAEAKRLNGKKPDPSDLPTQEKILEGYFHYRNLVQKVALETQKAQEEDFNKFVQAVADQVGRMIIPGENPRDVWNAIQENHLITQVIQLNLHEKELKFLPPEIGHLTNLKELYLDKNHLKTLPLELSSLSQLRHLTVNNNKLEFISNDIQLPQLQYFELRHNNLKQVPNLKAYPNLKILHLNDNQITDIPQEIDFHPRLNMVYLNDNPIPIRENSLSSSSRVELSHPLPISKEQFSRLVGDRWEDF